MRVPLRWILAPALLAIPATAQCPEWKAGFESPDVGATVRAMAQHDDGSGARLYVGGEVGMMAGGFPYRSILAWDGSAWSAVGDPGFGDVWELLSHDDGTGAQLYAAGGFYEPVFSGLLRWDGASWSSVGGGPDGLTYALAVWDDGTGPALYAAGGFNNAGGVPARGVAKWNGSAWSALGTGIDGTGHSLAVFDDGTGAALYLGGAFTVAGGVNAPFVARWNGSAWSSLGTSVDQGVYDMVVWDDGHGPALFCGGRFDTAGGVAAAGVARWDGSTWTGLNGLSGALPVVETLLVADDGSGTGPQLLAGGWFPGGIARRSGSGWTTLGSGLGVVNALAVFDDGTGRELYAGGSDFADVAGVHADSIARWDGSTWSELGAGQGLHGYPYALETFDDGAGEALYATGSFTWAGAASASSIARFDGVTWSELGSGLDGTGAALATFDDGGGAALYVGGLFTAAGDVPASNIACWDGHAWSPLGAGISADLTGGVAAFAVFDDGSGPALFVAGAFTHAGGMPASNVARWNGTAWSSVGTGTDGAVHALEVFDDGTGPALYAAGRFALAGGTSARCLARWDGASWTALATQITDDFQPQLLALRAFDDGHGAALYVGGSPFNVLSGGPLHTVLRWDGASWSELGIGIPGQVQSLEVFDEGQGTGPALFAGGAFHAPGSPLVTNLARWDGASWRHERVGEQLQDFVTSLQAFDDGAGAGPSLFVGGGFDLAGRRPSHNIAAWTSCGQTGRLICFGDGSGTACPCGNASAAADRVGCVNSTALGGKLRASGRASLAQDTLVLAGSQMTNGTVLYFQGTDRVNAGAGAVFGDGLRCAGGSTARLAIVPNAGGASQFPRAGDPTISVQGQVAAPGVRVYQAWFRDAQSFCTPAPFGLTNAVEIVWGI